MEGKPMDYKKALYDNYVKSQILPKSGNVINQLIKPRKAFLKRLILKHFPSNKQSKILDLGCGYGAILYFAKQMGYTNLQGIDFSLQQVETAKNLDLNFIRQGSIEEQIASISENSVDLIITFDVIEHMSKQEVYAFSKKIFSLLAHNGKWIIHVPNAESPFGYRMRHWDYTHELAFTHQSLNQLLTCVGFKDNSFHEDTPAVYGVKSGGRWVLWQFVRIIIKSYLLIETGTSNGIFTQNFLAIAKKGN